MLLTTLIGILILYMRVPLDGSAVSAAGTLTGVGAMAVLNAAAGWIGARASARLSARAGGASMGPVRIFRALQLGVVCFLVLDVYLFDWPGFVGDLFSGVPWLPLADELVLLAPLLVMLATQVVFHYCYELARGHCSLGLRRYMALRFRVEPAVVLVPLLMLAAMSDVVDMIYAQSPARDLAGAVAGGAFVVLLAVFGPLVLRALWHTSPLPPGPVRERLEALSRKLKFRCTDILMWHTYGFVPNAGIVGFLPFVRYVVITDAALAHLTADEIEAVFAHEMGHARKHHFLFYLLFAAAFVAFAANLLDLAAAAGVVGSAGDLLRGELTTGQAALMCLFAGLYWWAVFGWLSRRHEEQADGFVLGACERPEALVTALQRLALLSGTPERASSWRHFSIRRRVDFLTRALHEPDLVGRVDRKVRAIQWAMAALLVLSVVRLVVWRPELLGL